MADGVAELAARVVPFQRYYMCIDGTGTADSVEYGRLLEEKFGWRNLLTEFLEPDPNAAPNDNARLLDPNHPFLPICTFQVSGRKKPIAVVCPGGRNGQGLDPFWENYIGETPDERANQGKHVFTEGAASLTSFGRHTAAIKSNLFMDELILVPAIEKITEQGKSFAQLKQGLLSGSRDPTEPDIPAELLLLSSHGWLGGFMRGDAMQPSTVAQPADAQPGTVPFPVYFLVGRAALQRRFFFGPKWIILVQCSTLNNATWPLWTTVMASSIPRVRGVLGYEEVSPGVQGTIEIARDFFDRLKRGQPFLKAWRSANADQKWSAIVHKEAVGDVMSKWDVLKELTEAKFSPTETSYLAFGASLERGKHKLKSGKPVLDSPPPFKLTLERIRPGDPTATPPTPDEFFEISADTLDKGRAHLSPEITVRTTIHPPLNKQITGATIRWVHIREAHEPNPPGISVLFQSFESVPPQTLTLQISKNDARTLIVQSNSTPVDKIVINWKTQTSKVLEASVMEHHHSFVWPLIKIDVTGGTPVDAFPFSTQGLLF